MRLICWGVPSPPSVGVVALTAWSRGLVSWDLSVGGAAAAVVVVCLVSGRRNVAERVT